MNIDLNNGTWDRLRGFVTELKVDARWVLRENGTDTPLGSLRIASHPDLPPGHLRGIFTYMTSVREKSKEEKLKTIEDYQMEIEELEVYSVHDEIKTDMVEHKAPYRELEELFGVKIFV